MSAWFEVKASVMPAASHALPRISALALHESREVRKWETVPSMQRLMN